MATEADTEVTDMGKSSGFSRSRVEQMSEWDWAQWGGNVWAGSQCAKKNKNLVLDTLGLEMPVRPRRRDSR